MKYLDVNGDLWTQPEPDVDQWTSEHHPQGLTLSLVQDSFGPLYEPSDDPSAALRTVMRLDPQHPVADWLLEAVSAVGHIWPDELAGVREAMATGEGIKQALADVRGVTDIPRPWTSDGSHTFDELYHHRMLYNAMAFNEFAARDVWGVQKSWRHHDGELCFGGGRFIVTAHLPTGQVSNHYEGKNWDMFRVPERETAAPWDGHTPEVAARRMEDFVRQA